MIGRSVLVLAAVLGCWPLATAHAQIYRWDNGQLIPGTESIKLGPGVELNRWNTSAQNLRYGNFKGDLSGALFSDSWLDDADFAGTQLTNALLDSSTLSRANLTGADLANAQLGATSLDLANLTGANLANANLSNSRLADAVLTGAVVRGARFQNALNFEPAQLYSTHSYGAKDLEGIQLQNLQLTGWNFSGQNLTNSNFGSSTLKNADFTGAVINGASFAATTFRGFTSAQLYSTQNYIAKDLRGVQLQDNNLTGWDFSDQNLQGANLAGLLKNTNFTGAIVKEAQLPFITPAQLYSTQSYADKDLQGTFIRGDFTGGEFRGQNFTSADFSNSTLRLADLSATNLTNTDFVRSSFELADLARANLTNANLSWATLKGTILTGAIVKGAQFRYVYDFKAGQLYSTQSYLAKDLSGIGLQNINLNGWNFRGQNLSRADLSGSRITHANFIGANLASASFYQSTLDNAKFSGANLTNVYLEESSLTNADLAGVDLRGAKQANLTGAKFKNTILPDGQINGLDLSGWFPIVIRDEDGISGTGNPAWLESRPSIPVKIQQHMTVADGGVMQLLFEADPWDSKISFQPDIPVQLGGTLKLDFTDDVPLAAQSGRTIKVFDWTGVNPQSQFKIAPQLGTAWDTSQLYTTGEVTMLGFSGDLNQDWYVDSADLLAFLEYWTGHDYPARDRTWTQGDSDGDGDVDSADMLTMLSQWTGAAAQRGSAASVPEPSATVLLGSMITCIIGAATRRRKWC